MNNINNFEDLFVNVLSTTATAEAAKQSMREAIFWQIVNRTAVHTRVDENTFEGMKEVAEFCAEAESVEFYCNDKVVETLTFTVGDCQKQLRTMHKLYDIVMQYEAWYEDRNGAGNTDDGFCWLYNKNSYTLIFKK